MKVIFPTAVYILFLICERSYGQNDSVKIAGFEITAGIPMIYPFYTNLSAEGSKLNSGPKLSISLIQKFNSETAISYNVNLKYRRDLKSKYVIGVLYCRYLSRTNHQYLHDLIILNGGLESRLTSKKDSKFSFHVLLNASLGLIHNFGHAYGGMFTYPKYYSNANIFIFGLEEGLSFQYKLNKRFYIENELRLLTYATAGYADVLMFYGKERIYMKRTGVAFSRLLSLNVGYKF